MKSDFYNRIPLYFPKQSDLFIKLLDCPCSKSFFINMAKADRQDILSLIDFSYEQSALNINSFYHQCSNIGKSLVYDLGLIYPQDVASSLGSCFVDTENIKTVVDMCSAPGGKSINLINRLNKDVIFICNDTNYSRSLTLSANLERLGLDNVIITNKDCAVLSKEMNNCADLVILDAPCSAEGMIRKFPQILDEYSLNNIAHLAKIQKQLLSFAYNMLNENGQLLYSTCTYSFEEDEQQIINFLNDYPDMELINLKDSYASLLNGTCKLSPLNNTEGQFIALLRKHGSGHNKCRFLKPVNSAIIKDFINKNLYIDNYYLYKYKEDYYLSLIPLYDLGSNIIRYGIHLGKMLNNRFEPDHCLYRANSLIGKYKYIYEINEQEYYDFISGKELKTSLSDNNYYLISYKKHSLGFGKNVNGTIKNKYPKGLRRVV